MRSRPNKGPKAQWRRPPPAPITAARPAQPQNDIATAEHAAPADACTATANNLPVRVPLQLFPHHKLREHQPHNAGCPIDAANLPHWQVPMFAPLVALLLPMGTDGRGAASFEQDYWPARRVDSAWGCSWCRPKRGKAEGAHASQQRLPVKGHLLLLKVSAVLLVHEHKIEKVPDRELVVHVLEGRCKLVESSQEEADRY